MKKKIGALSLALAGLWLWRGRSRNTDSAAASPGNPKTLGTTALEAGAALLQGRSPLRAMNMYLDGFHLYADDMGRQMEAHHYCGQVNEDLVQCAIFDGNTSNAKLMGVEYIVSRRLFESLPEQEKRLWHSHDYEVTSGTLIAPGLPVAVENILMEKIVDTYGKTWHTWDTGKDDLPLGIPSLMMGFTRDGQLRDAVVNNRDRRFNVSSEARRESRRSIPKPRVAPGANAWEHGRTCQLKLEEMQTPSGMLAHRRKSIALATESIATVP